MEIKIGDVVNTTKHDNSMTVREVNGNEITCNWFDECDQLHQEIYNRIDVTIR